MLYPFHGHLLADPGPVSGAVAAALARRIREDARRYQPADALDRAVEAGLVARSARPALYRYRMIGRSGRAVIGTVGEVAVADLRAHERTTDGPVVPAPPVEIRPILVVASGGTPDAPPAGDAVAVTEAGVRHEVAPVAADAGYFGGEPLVIADGHHRVRAVAATRGPRARILALVVGDSGRGLTVGTFHRRFDGIGSLPASVADAFTVEATERRRPPAGCLLWVRGKGETLLLRPRAEAVEQMPEPLRGSAAAIASWVLYPLLGVADADARPAATVRAAVSGLDEHQASLLMPPPPMGVVLGAALAGTPLPPKTTRFSPKPVRGIIGRVAESA